MALTAQAQIDARRELVNALNQPAFIAELVVTCPNGNENYITNPMPAVIYDAVQKHPDKKPILIHSSYDGFSVDATFFKDAVTPVYRKPEENGAAWLDHVTIQLSSESIAITNSDGEALVRLKTDGDMNVSLRVDAPLNAATGYAEFVEHGTEATA